MVPLYYHLEAFTALQITVPHESNIQRLSAIGPMRDGNRDRCEPRKAKDKKER
jgi:hypothetical protein